MQWLKDHSFVNRFIFPAPEPGYTESDFGSELCWIPCPASARHPCDIGHVPCLLLQAPRAKYMIVYLHGNGEDIGFARGFVDHLRNRLHVHVLAMEYPGYGVCKGSPSEGETLRDPRGVSNV